MRLKRRWHNKRLVLVLMPRGLLAFLILLLIGCSASYAAWAALKQPSVKSRQYWEKTGMVIWEVKVKEPVIALTFDDGPSPLFTPQILAILKDFDARATFFELGQQVEAYPELARAVVAEGNEIGNHTYSHRYPSRISVKELENQIAQAEDVINSATGQTTFLFRPPGGYYDEEVITAAHNLGYLVVLWSWGQNTNDWTNPGSEVIAQQVLANSRPGGIILLHDRGGDRTQTVEALPPILKGLKDQGYRFVTVSELLKYEDLSANGQ